LVDPADADSVVGAQPAAGLPQRGRRRRRPLQLRGLLLELRAPLLRFMLLRQRLRTRLLGLGLELLEAEQLRRPPLLPPEVATGPGEQVPRQLEPAGDLERVAHAELADVQPVGRP